MTSFHLAPVGLRWVPNYEGTRWFLVLRLARPGGDQLNRLLQACNLVAAASGLPLLYAPPPSPPPPSPARVGVVRRGSRASGAGGLRGRGSGGGVLVIQDFSDSFHVSIGWCLERPSDEMLESVETVGEGDVRALSVHVQAIKAKVGNVVTSFPLAVPRAESGGILGV